MEERLQKILAQAGVASRRKAEELIEQGRVTVNGALAKLGDKADPHQDDIRVDGTRLRKPERLRYIMLNKPRGVLSAAERQDQIDRPTVVEMVDAPERVYPVGRLDLNSEGLVLLTNDGDLTNRITHPRYGHEKTYKVLIAGQITEDTLSKWRRGGIILPDGFKTSRCTVKLLDRATEGTWLRIVMREGHKRQIRDTAEVLGHSVKKLVRTHIGTLAMGDLPPGKWRDLTHEEVNALREGKHLDKPEDDRPRRPRRPTGDKAAAARRPSARPGGSSSRSGSGGSRSGGGARPSGGTRSSGTTRKPSSNRGKDRS